MHYLFENETKLRAFLRNVSDRLEPGGYFIGSTVDSERVIYKIRNEGKGKLNIGNRYYRI
jgi:mRNA (guanine-N7-)-methyltransferase